MRYHLTVMTQVGRIRNNFKRLSHASPCLQGEGRVGIRSRQWVAIKARANSQKPKNRLLPPRLGLYRISVPAASLPYPSLAKQGRACAQSHWFVPSIETLTLITWRAAGSRPYSGAQIYTNLLSCSGRGESGVRQLTECVTKLAAGPARQTPTCQIVEQIC